MKPRSKVRCQYCHKEIAPQGMRNHIRSNHPEHGIPLQGMKRDSQTVQHIQRENANPRWKEYALFSLMTADVHVRCAEMDGQYLAITEDKVRIYDSLRELIVNSREMARVEQSKPREIAS